MIKHILVPTDGSEFSAGGVRYAVAVAKHHGASLHGLHIVDLKLLEGPFLRDVSASLGTAPYLNYQGNIAMILEERGQAALEAFRKSCEDAGVDCETRLVTGMVPRGIIDQSELVDLIIMGRSGEHSQWLEGLLGSTTQAIVRRAKQPVLVTGTDVPGTDLFVAAYDGSQHAKRALQTAGAVSADWRVPLHVLSVSDKHASALLAEARSYLCNHEMPVEYMARSGDPSETIVTYAADSKADLIVMGAYGHTKVRELVVGSTTAYVMNHAHCPLLLIR